MSILSDATAAITHGFIALDRDEATALGAPHGDTISLFAAVEQRHGSAIAHIVCLGLWLVQFHHCRDQIAHLPMRWDNYVRASVLLAVFTPVVLVIGAVRWLLGSEKT